MNVNSEVRSLTRTGSYRPDQYRLAQRGNRLVLQGYFVWTDGNLSGGDWLDIPTVLLDDGTTPDSGSLRKEGER